MDFIESILAQFTYLADVPSSYTGQSGKLVSVKTAEDGLEFVSVSFPTSMQTTN